jgi:addiction module HigA family antidote
MLLEEFLVPMGVSQTEFARHLGWTSARLNEIIKGKRGVTPESALAFSDALGTSPDIWLDLQQHCDLYDALQKHRKVPQLKRVG